MKETFEVFWVVVLMTQICVVFVTTVACIVYRLSNIEFSWWYYPSFMGGVFIVTIFASLLVGLFINIGLL